MEVWPADTRNFHRAQYTLGQQVNRVHTAPTNGTWLLWTSSPSQHARRVRTIC